MWYPITAFFGVGGFSPNNSVYISTGRPKFSFDVGKHGFRFWICMNSSVVRNHPNNPSHLCPSIKTPSHSGNGSHSSNLAKKSSINPIILLFSLLFSSSIVRTVSSEVLETSLGLPKIWHPSVILTD